MYVTASRSEGFGLPIAEAAASGLAVIAPAGGAVEEITDPSFTKYVESQITEQPQESHDDGMSVMTNNGDCVTIKASMSHLVSTLEHVTKDQKFRQKASVFARNYALRYLSQEVPKFGNAVSERRCVHTICLYIRAGITYSVP